ncbi:MAG: hypothetical protein KF898_03155 [Parachlamydiales bacterium]|nr:hypothetical protein [Candidatus Acheromyda pituitae]
MSTNLAVNDSATNQLIPEATAGTSPGQSAAMGESTATPAPTSAAPGFDFDCNVFAILTMAIAEMSNSDMSLTTVQSEGILQNTQVEASISSASEASLQKIESQMNSIIKNDGWEGTNKKGNPTWYTLGSSECQSEMSYLNTEFSTDMQEGNMNTQMIQANLQEQESEIQMSEDALKSLSQLFNLPNQILSFVSNLISSSPL